MTYTMGILNHMINTSSTEAIADVMCVEKDTGVSIPSYEAVERAKAWIEENEK